MVCHCIPALHQRIHITNLSQLLQFVEETLYHLIVKVYYRYCEVISFHVQCDRTIPLLICTAVDVLSMSVEDFHKQVENSQQWYDAPSDITEIGRTQAIK